MRITITLIFLILNFCSYSQKDEIKYFNIEGKEVSKKKFYKLRDYNTNHQVFYNTDSIIVAKLIPRKKYGKLSKTEYNQIIEYLNQKSSKQLDSTKSLVINYLSSTPKEPYFGTKSQWTIFRKSYLNKLKKFSNVQQCWVNNPANKNLNYFHKDKINWIEDKNRIIENVFFPIEFEFGSFVVINPSGNFISYYAEYGEEKVINLIKECLKLG